MNEIVFWSNEDAYNFYAVGYTSSIFVCNA